MDEDEVQIIDVSISKEKRNKTIKEAVKRRQITIDGQQPPIKPLSGKGFVRASSLPQDPLTSRKRKSDALNSQPEITKAKTISPVGFVQASSLLSEKSLGDSGSSKIEASESDDDFQETSTKKLTTPDRSGQGKDSKKMNPKVKKRRRSKRLEYRKERSSIENDVDSISSVDQQEMDNKDIDFLLLRVERSVTMENSPEKQKEKGKVPGNETDYFDALPRELQQRIFTLLPSGDLQNCIKVSRGWYSVIKDKRFMKWKKDYHKLRHQLESKCQRDEDTSKDALETLFSILKLTKTISMFLERNDHHLAMAHTLPRVLSFFSSYCPSTGSGMLPYLQQRPLWSVMKRWFAERFPDSLQRNGEPFAWSFLASCFLVARRVEDTEWIWSSMMRQFSESLCVIIDFLYALAYLLRLMSLVCQAGVWYRMHYRIVYRLLQMEKSGRICLGQLQDRIRCRGQQSIVRFGSADTKLSLTHEQLMIARHELKEGDVIRINAFAGTGKTTTLLNFARFNPGTSFILIVYNKAAQLHALKLFPKNVECRTGHSLAFQAVGKRYRYKLGNVNQRSLVELLPGESSGGGNLFRRVKLARNALDNFIGSSDKKISQKHVTSEANSKEITQAVHDAIEVWRMMQDTDHPCKMSHDGYLKMWQLSEPVFSNFDAILVDEAQDMNPCLLDVVTRQSQPKIFVGDPHQQIYAFRGSVNVLDLVDATHVYHLTQSFRFGEPIAFAAQSILCTAKKMEHLITGTNRRSSIHGDYDADGQMTVICRNNANVFFVAYSIASDCTKSIHVIGGLEGLGVKMILQIYYMTLPEEERKAEHIVSESFLMRFIQPTGSLSGLVKYAMMAEDVELMERIKIVQKLGSLVPIAVSKVKLMQTSDRDRARFVITTAHKSKGLEFRSVLLYNDLEVVKVNGEYINEETNLLYVAATRAQYFLAINHSLHQILSWCGENFVQLREPSNDQTDLQEEKTSIFKPFHEPFIDFKRFFERPNVSRALVPVASEWFENRLMSWKPLCDVDEKS